jgi:hypothetical protein
MGSWILKTALQRAISGLPRSHWWNGLLQRYVTGGLRIQPYGEFQEKLRACRRHFEYYRAFSRQPREDFNAVEIGTGWFPVIPIGLYLCGAREIWTYDIVRLLAKDTFSKVIEYFCLFAQTGEISKILSAVRPSAVSTLMELAPLAAKASPVDFLERLNIHALVKDVRNSGLADGSVNMVFSNGVFELLEPTMVSEILAEIRRLSSSDSVMSHYICIADQFANFDKSITRFNNLQYSAGAWRWLKSPLVPQSRLRISDYRRAYVDAGFEIVAEEDLNGAESDLASIKLAPEFLHYDLKDLLVLYSWLVGRPRDPGENVR